MISLDKLSYMSAIRMHNPNEKVCFSLSFLLLCILCNHWFISILVFLLMSFSSIFVAKISRKIYLKLLSLPLIFTMLGVLGIVFSQWDLQKEIPKEVYFLSASLLMKSFASTSCLYFLVLSTPMVDIIYSLSCCKLPSLFLELMMLMYRYIFVLLEFSYIVFVSQDSRLGYMGYKKSIHSLAKLVSSLFLGSYWKAEECFSAMESRLYQGEIKVLRMSYRSNRKNYYKIFFLLMAYVFLYYYIAF